MRINVYEEEFTGKVTVVTEKAKNGREYTGIRLWLKTPAELKDSKSAVTFWVDSKVASGFAKGARLLDKTFVNALLGLREKTLGKSQ